MKTKKKVTKKSKKPFKDKKATKVKKGNGPELNRNGQPAQIWIHFQASSEWKRRVHMLKLKKGFSNQNKWVKGLIDLELKKAKL